MSTCVTTEIKSCEETKFSDDIKIICKKIHRLEYLQMTPKIHTIIVVLGLKAGYMRDVDRLYMSGADDDTLDSEHTTLGDAGYFKKYCQGELKYIFDEVPEIEEYLGFTQKTRYDCVYNKRMVPDSFFESDMTDSKFATLFSYLKHFDFIKKKPTHIHRLILDVDEELNEIYVQLAYEDLSEQLTVQYKQWEIILKDIFPKFPGFSFEHEIQNPKVYFEHDDHI